MPESLRDLAVLTFLPCHSAAMEGHLYRCPNPSATVPAAMEGASECPRLRPVRAARPQWRGIFIDARIGAGHRPRQGRAQWRGIFMDARMA